MFKSLLNRQYFFNSLLYCSLFLILTFTLFFYFSLSSLAQTKDALAIRIYGNPNNYSAERWYNNEFGEDDPRRGSPQSIPDVDGYRAVQDGRTVYVNAGNINAGKFYANIYTLSFSQEPERTTMAVHTNMLKHWTFNTNMLDDLAVPANFGTCSIPAKVCLENDDCLSGYECKNHKCRLPIAKENETTCWRDSSCKPAKTALYCSGAKAKVTRRTKRLADLADIKIMIQEYLNEGNDLPKLKAGTYLPGITISTWPSWNDTFAEIFAKGDFPKDPINTMGNCPSNFSPETCWDDANRTFAGGNVTNTIITSPSNSSFYGYNADPGNESVYSFSPDGTIICPLDGSVCHN